MRLNSTGVAEGLSCNACDRKVTGSSLKMDFFFNYWNTGVTSICRINQVDNSKAFNLQITIDFHLHA